MMVQCLTSFAVKRKACASLKSSLCGSGEDKHVPHQPRPETFGSAYLSQWASLMNECHLLWRRWVLHLQESPKRESVNVSCPGQQYWHLVKASAERHPSARSLPRPHAIPPPRRWRSLSQRLGEAEGLSPAWSASLKKQEDVGDLTPTAVKQPEDFQNRLFPYSSCKYMPINWYLPIKQQPLQEIKPVHDHTASMAAILKMDAFSWDKQISQKLQKKGKLALFLARSTTLTVYARNKLWSCTHTSTQRRGSPVLGEVVTNNFRKKHFRKR